MFTIELLTEIDFSNFDSGEINQVIVRLRQSFLAINNQNIELISFLTNSSTIIEKIAFRETDTESLSLVIEPLLNLIDNLLNVPFETFRDLPDVANK